MWPGPLPCSPGFGYVKQGSSCAHLKDCAFLYMFAHACLFFAHVCACLRMFAHVCSMFAQCLLSLLGVCAAFAQRLRSVCVLFAQCLLSVCAVFVPCLRMYVNDYACLRMFTHSSGCCRIRNCLCSVCVEFAQSLHSVFAAFAQRLSNVCADTFMFTHACADIMFTHVYSRFSQGLRKVCSCLRRAVFFAQ